MLKTREALDVSAEAIGSVATGTGTWSSGSIGGVAGKDGGSLRRRAGAGRRHDRPSCTGDMIRRCHGGKRVRPIDGATLAPGAPALGCTGHTPTPGGCHDGGEAETTTISGRSTGLSSGGGAKKPGGDIGPGPASLGCSACTLPLAFHTGGGGEPDSSEGRGCRPQSLSRSSDSHCDNRINSVRERCWTGWFARGKTHSTSSASPCMAAGCRDGVQAGRLSKIEPETYGGTYMCSWSWKMRL